MHEAFFFLHCKRCDKVFCVPSTMKFSSIQWQQCCLGTLKVSELFTEDDEWRSYSSGCPLVWSLQDNAKCVVLQKDISVICQQPSLPTYTGSVTHSSILTHSLMLLVQYRFRNKSFSKLGRLLGCAAQALLKCISIYPTKPNKALGPQCGFLLLMVLRCTASVTAQIKAALGDQTLASVPAPCPSATGKVYFFPLGRASSREDRCCQLTGTGGTTTHPTASF